MGLPNCIGYIEGKPSGRGDKVKGHKGDSIGPVEVHLMNRVMLS